jgi:beta-phosphoglucomutase-like phosphatase (HAD superfamily)
VAINGDEFEGKGKPDPSSYIAALQRLEIPSSHALIVENASAISIYNTPSHDRKTSRTS